MNSHTELQSRTDDCFAFKSPIYWSRGIHVYRLCCQLHHIVIMSNENNKIAQEVTDWFYCILQSILWWPQASFSARDAEASSLQ